MVASQRQAMKTQNWQYGNFLHLFEHTNKELEKYGLGQGEFHDQGDNVKKRILVIYSN
jgi:hypothetical protein